MFEARRSQIAVYAVIALVLLLVGLNSLRAGPDSGGGSSPVEVASAGADQGPTSRGQGDRANSDLRMAAGDELIVDVSGGVRRPGVYRFPRGSRVIDAIERAGGPVDGALPGAINRAAELADGQQVVVPLAAGAGTAGGVPSAGGVDAASAGATVPGAADAPISLSSATPEQLEEIEGIGPVTAAKIIEFRDSNGGGSIEDLDQVSGIGPVTMEALRSRLQP